MKRRLEVILIGFLALSVVVFLNNKLAPFSLLSSVTQFIFSIPKSQLYKAKSFLSPLPGSLSIESLTEENKKLTERMVDYTKLKQDNEAFKSQFETTDIKSTNLMPAHIVGFLGDFLSPSSFVLDKGESDGVRKGMAVIVGKNLIGRIGKVSAKYSQVTLIFNKDFTALAKSDTGAAGIIQGEGDFIFFDKVAITDSLEKGSIITTKGEVGENGIGMQGDLIIGKVASLNKNSSSPFQTAKIESALSFAKLNMVFIQTQ